MGQRSPVEGGAAGFRLPPALRITRSAEIRALFRKGRKKKTSHLDVFFLSSRRPVSRIGVVVPKHHRRVVDRNRVRRRLKEIGRKDILPAFSERQIIGDLLIRARKEAYEASFRQLRRELLEVTEEICSGRPSRR
jgi:ribonuclease P protein component